MQEIHLAAEGWPPAKNEALSIFNPAHTQRDRVLRLLEAARQALSETLWDRDESRSIGLELVVIESGTDPALADATNSLGGVGDVLQSNRRNADLSHFGDAAHASLYADDRQIREVRYSVERGDAPGYRVRIWVLEE